MGRLDKCPRGGDSLPLDEQPLGSVAPPTVRVRQFLHQFARAARSNCTTSAGCSETSRQRTRQNASVRRPLARIDGAPGCLVGDPLRVFDPAAVKIGDIQALRPDPLPERRDETRDSAAAKNSPSAIARFDRNDGPSATNLRRWTRLRSDSQTKASPA